MLGATSVVVDEVGRSTAVLKQSPPDKAHDRGYCRFEYV